MYMMVEKAFFVLFLNFFITSKFSSKAQGVLV